MKKTKAPLIENKTITGFLLRPDLIYRGVPWNKGKKFPERSGENSSNWKGGVSKNKEYRNAQIRAARRLRWEEVLFKNRQRNFMKKANGGTHAFNEWLVLKKLYNNSCANCKKSESEVKLTQDHILPLSKGGTDYIWNIQPLCLHCNCTKKARTIDFRFGGYLYL